MKKTVIFGAGQIGRGFIGDFCSEEGYFLVFVDVDKRLVDRLNEQKSYPLWILGKEKVEKKITSLKALPLEETEQIVREIAGTSLVFTAVGANNLTKLAPVLARGIEQKHSQESDSFLNIVICENLLGSARILNQAISDILPSGAKTFLKENVGLVETVVSRMVAPLTEELKETNPLLVRVEPYNILPVHKPAFKGKIPEINAFRPVRDLYPYEELKLFGHNLTHAAVAYAGYQEGCTYIWEAMQNPQVLQVLNGVTGEIHQALMKKHGFSAEEVERYLSDLKERFQNKLLGDTVHRVGRDPLRKLGPNERIMGAISLCLSQAVFPQSICLVAVLALCYNYQNDPSAQKLQEMLKNQGLDHVLRNVCGLAPSEAYVLIRQRYAELTQTH